MVKRAELLEGLSREQYIRQQVKLEGIDVLEADWKELLRWVVNVSGNIGFYDLRAEKSQNWGKFWKNQLLVILTELVLFDVEGVRNQFLLNKGTGKERETLGKLQEFLVDIEQRLKRCRHNLLLASGKDGRLVLEGIVSGLLERLEKVTNREKGALKFTEEGAGNSLFFFQMLDILGGLGKDYAYYLSQIVQSGEVEPALAELYVFLKNYTRRAEVFNSRLGELPVFYLKEILHSSARRALPDHTWIVLNKTPGMGAVVVPVRTAFAGVNPKDGSVLNYLSADEVVVTDMQLEHIYSVLLECKGMHPLALIPQDNWITTVCRQEIPLLSGEEAPELFGKGGISESEVAIGWMFESPMFDLREGDRYVELRLFLEQSSVSFLAARIGEICGETGEIKEIFEDALIVKVSCEEGWLKAGVCKTVWDKSSGCLEVRFRISENDTPLMVCTDEVHGVSTQYPAIQLVLNEKAFVYPYSWASGLCFERLTVYVNVKGITELKIYSEFGELDSSVPFYPFGVQAKKGAWFICGNYEMARKPLTKATLSFKWQQLPTEERGFAEHYALYPTDPPIHNFSFEVWTQMLKERKWVDQSDPVRLFNAKGEGTKVEENGSVTFPIFQRMPVVNVTEENYSWGKVRNGFLRVVLAKPEMGFGTELYRQLFAKAMMVNSRKPKDTDIASLPAEPVTPMINDLELCYEAEDTFSLTETGGQVTEMRFYQLKPLAWKPFLPVLPGKALPLAEKEEEAAHLLFAICQASGNALMRIYFDMTMRKDEIGFSDSVWHEMKVNWYYNNGLDWQLLPSEQVLQENTHVFTRAGLVVLMLPEPVREEWLDENGRFWLRASILGDYRECRLVRGFYLNAVELVADGGDGYSLPVGSITQCVAPIPGIESVDQFVAGFGGCPPEDEKFLSLRMAHRIAHRGRAVNPTDFERMAMEQFPVLEKVHCITVSESESMGPIEAGERRVRLVVMSREQGGAYPLCSLVTLQDIQKRLSACISPFIKLEVSNPVYEKIRIHCHLKLQSPMYVGAVLRKLQSKINFYIAPWLYRNRMPELNRGISLQGLFTILANESGVARLEKLEVERVDELNPEKKYYDLKIDTGFSTVSEDLTVTESVCGGVFIPDENHDIVWE